MKNLLKKITLNTFILVLFISLSGFEGFGNATMKILITEKTTKTELEGMIKDLQKSKIDLNITEVKYTQNERIKSIKGTIKFQDEKNSGSFSSDKLKKIEITKSYGLGGGVQIVVTDKIF